MRRTLFLNILLLLFSICFINKVNAACDYETQVKLATEAANVKIQYEAGWYGTGEFVESEEPNENGEYLTEIEEPRITVSIYNLTPNIYITVKNKLTQDVKTYRYENTNEGSLSFIRTDIENIVDYDITIYSNNSNCLDEKLLSVPLLTPKYNDYHNQYYCINSKKYYCQEFITTEINMTEQEIWKDYEKNSSSNPSEPPELKNDFWKKYQWWFIGGSTIILIVIGVATTAILLKRKRSRVI